MYSRIWAQGSTLAFVSVLGGLKRFSTDETGCTCKASFDRPGCAPNRIAFALHYD
jgi:hypothetical protein